MTSTHHHLLFVCIPGWGHIRPGLAYAIRLLQETSHLTVTFPTPTSWSKQIDDEIAKYIPDTQDPLRSRLRTVRIGEIVDEGSIIPTFIGGLFPFCTSLFTLDPYQQVNGTLLSIIQPPDICLLDPAFWDLFCLIRTFESNIPILILFPANTTAMLLVVGPEEIGGKGDVTTKAELLAKETGRNINEIYIELFMPATGQITDLVGLPKVYDYECHIKLTPFMISALTGMYPKIYQLLRDCDGIVTTSTHLYEPESNDAFKAYYKKSGRSYYVVGPLALTSTDQLSRERSSDRDAIKKFLDSMLQERGERSVIYVSFGSAYWPLDIEASWKVLEIIYEKQIPMILAHNDEYGRPPIPDSLRAKLEASDSVLISTWAPQNMVLGHKATAWFLTHCGQNSVLESLSHGIPMIAWPVDADQPINAMYVGDLKHKVGYELLEVLQRDGSKPLYRRYTPSGTLDAVETEFRTVLKNAFGRDGAEKRRNAEMFKEKLSRLWNEDADARMELRRFIKDYLS